MYLCSTIAFCFEIFFASSSLQPEHEIFFIQKYILFSKHDLQSSFSGYQTFLNILCKRLKQYLNIHLSCHPMSHT